MDSFVDGLADNFWVEAEGVLVNHAALEDGAGFAVGDEGDLFVHLAFRVEGFLREFEACFCIGVEWVDANRFKSGTATF